MVASCWQSFEIETIEAVSLTTYQSIISMEATVSRNERRTQPQHSRAQISVQAKEEKREQNRGLKLGRATKNRKRTVNIQKVQLFQVPISINPLKPWQTLAV